ncbi:MAG TPA: hypothetical protein VEU96_20230 [Bryobacteraceae bacterium]|nr:hypothetical protein [Bryobacteraceae bacterium]
MTQQQSPAVLQRTPYWHYAAIFLIPTILYWINPNWCFQNLGHMDPWYYFGEFWHSARFEDLLKSYPGERITWIAPGHVLAHVFGYVPGTMILHWLVFLMSLFSVHDILRGIAGVRTAFLGAVLLGCHPFFISANGWDYPEGMEMALVSLSFAVLLRASSSARHSDLLLFVSAMLWSGVIYTYIGWAALTPAFYLAAVYLCAPRIQMRSLIRTGMIIALGGFATTALLSSLFLLLGAHRFFFRENVKTALPFARMKGPNPWLEGDWYTQPSWLFFPVLAFCLALMMVIASRTRKPGTSKQFSGTLWFYLMTFGILVILTLRPTRLLAFQYHTSLLLPGAFLVLALLLFREPQQAPSWQVYLAGLIAAALSVTPLARVNPVQITHYWSWIAIVFTAFIALAVIRLLRPASGAWSVAVILAGASSFLLIPRSPGLAWTAQYNGKEISERVARAVQDICNRVPPGRLPVFWINNNDDPRAAEYRGVMCAFVTHGKSMWDFPKLDPTKHYHPGTPIILVTEKKDVVEPASETLAKAGMPVKLISQDLIAYGSQPYWVTCLEVLP